MTTKKRHWSWRPQSSLATQSTRCTPGGNTEPEGGVQTMVTLVSQSSVAVTVYVTGAPFGLQTQLVILPGQIIRGGAESLTTTTLKEQKAVLPAVSIARQ